MIVDEAHRSHYDSLDGYARHLRDALPYATMIAFTGTPISEADRDTRQVFGDYIDIYDHTRAVDDKATVPVYYEPRHIPVDLPGDIDPELIDERADEATAGLDDSERERIQRTVAVMNELYGAPDRLRALADDIVRHWESRSELMRKFIGGPGKGIIVCATRSICARLYDEIVALRPDGAVNYLRDPGNPEDQPGEGEPSLADRFRAQSARLARFYALCASTGAVNDYRDDIAFFEEVRVWMAKFDAEERKASGLPIPADGALYLRQLTAGAIEAGGVTNLYEAYDAVAQNESAVRETGTGILADIARDLVKSLRRDVTTDWVSRDDVRAKLRSTIKRLLARHGYPPDAQPAAAELVIRQMETFADEWSLVANW